MNKLIEKLEKLDKDATPKSWELTFMDPEGFPSFFLDKELTKDLTNSDLNLIEETRNALPEIIQALKQGEKMREALEFYADKKSWGDGNDFYECLVQIHSSDFEDTPDDPNFIYGEYNPPIGGKKARQTLKEVFGE